MIKITRSFRLERLAYHFADHLETIDFPDPLESVSVVVPNLDTSRWLKLFLAEQNGIAANFDFMLPAEWQYLQFRKLYPDLPSVLPSDPGPMKWTVYELLLNENIREKFSVLDRYIRNQPVEIREQLAMQLAGQLTSVFDQYLVYRPEMILRWQQNQSVKAEEKWQARFWNALQEHWKEIEGPDKNLNRADLYQHTINAVKKGEVKQERPLFLFNPGLIPKPVVSMVHEFSDSGQTYIYRIVPTRDSANQTNNRLLDAFGDESKSTAVLFSGLKGDVYSDFSIDENSDGMLQKIQHSIIKNQPVELGNEYKSKGNGIEVHSCHTPLREVETLHRFLLKQFDEKPNLHPDDILVVTPDLDTYEPAIHAVFGTGEESLPAIPYHVGYRNMQEGVSLERLILQILRMPDSRFIFSDVLDLFQSEPILNRYGVSESGAGRIRQWMEDNNVIWGLDENHRKEWDQPGEKNQTWHSALKRGWLGQWFGGETGEDHNGILLYHGVDGIDRQEDWAAFSAFLHDLDLCRKESSGSHTLTEWCDLFDLWFERFFASDTQQSRQGIQIMQMREKIRTHAEVVQSNAAVPFSVFRKEIRSAFEKNSASTAAFTRGVTFSSMVPVRSVPARIIALIGLNESGFPRKPKSPDFDLMAQYPEPTDRNRKNEDKNLFLESILAAKDILYCSYIGQSRTDNEEIPPSPVVSEWVEQIANALGTDSDDIIQKEPLHAFSAANFIGQKSFSPSQFYTAKKLTEQENPVRGLKVPDKIPAPAEFQDFGIYHLVMFYSNPVKYFLKNRFDLQMTEEEELKDEFRISALEKHILFERVFGWKLEEKSNDDITSMLIRSGMMPVGWAGKLEIDDIIIKTELAISEIKEKGLTPELVDVDISIPLGSNELKDTVISFSNDQFLDITPSSFSGEKAMRTWIRHLSILNTRAFENKESELLCELKKDKRKWFRFKKPEDPGRLLKELIDGFRNGMEKPVHFFPKTSYKFEESITKGKDDPEGDAKNEFEGGRYNQFSEGRDPFVNVLLGEDASYQSAFVETAIQPVIRQMMDHMEEIK